MSRLLSSIRERWQGETDGAGLAVVRMLLAFSVLIEMLQTWFDGGITDRIVDPQFHFKYTLFPWVGPPQGLMPFVFVWSLALVAVMVLIGWRTRWTAALLAAGYIYWFLIDAANYSDHGYLVCLLAVLVAVLPGNRWASVDAYMGRELRTIVPNWSVELVRAQVVLVYLFFGVSLLNSDWLSGAPLIPWAESDTDNRAAMLLAGKPGLVLGIAWFIPLLYLISIPGLYWKRTRPYVWLGLTAFHLWDFVTFQLSPSPWLLSGINIVFCDTARLRSTVQGLVNRIPQWSLLRMTWGGMCRAGLLVDKCVAWFDDTPLIGEAKSKTKAYVEPSSPPLPAGAFPVASRFFVATWLILQCWLPIRYITVDSQPDWTDLTTMFAWRGQHRDKQCELKMSAIQVNQELRWPLDPTDEFPVPQALFYSDEKLEKLGLSEGTLKDLVTGPDDTRAERFAVYKLPPEEVQKIVSQYQATLQLRLADHQYEQLVQRPEFVRQYAIRIGEVLNGLLAEPVQVHANLQVRLNHRPVQAMLSDEFEENLLTIRSANELADKLPRLSSPLPAVAERIEVAKAWHARRLMELEQDYDIVLDKSRPKGEPVKLPAFSDEDERWFQEYLARNK